MHPSGRTSTPVFVDRTGRRRRLFALAGTTGGLLLALASVALVAGFTGAGTGHLPALPAPAVSEVPGAGPAAKPSATIRPPRPAPSPGPTGPADPAATSPAAPAGTPSQPVATPSRVHTNNGKAPSHPPRRKPAKGT